MSYRKSGIAGVVGSLFVFSMVAGCGVEWEEGQENPVLPGLEGLDKEKAVVYGTDNRTDVYAHSNATLQARAQQSTVALMAPESINASNPNNVTFNAYTLGASQSLCTSERFYNDPAAAFCSGTLIDDDLVLTAGHCITNTTDCNGTRFVFNYYRSAAGTLHTVTTADIFSCRSIVARQQATVGGRNLDFAVIRLDRAATPRFTPAPVRAGNQALAPGQNVAVIGSGSGIPFKIDNGGYVRDARSSTLDYFIATTDTFGGNSGSGVYETNGYTVAGILVRGDTDYVANGRCNVVNVCTETGCRGEDITYVRNAIDAYCAVATSQRLCNTTNPDPEPEPDPIPDTTATSYAYTASNTNNATVSTVNRTVSLAAGQTITVGTCGVTGSSFNGDTYLRVVGSSGTEVARNDDACGGHGSSLSFKAQATGTFEIRAGCYANTACGGTVAWTITTASPSPVSSGSFNFSANNTNNAQRNTVNQNVTVNPGQSITLGTCGVTGASFNGDTYIRLFTSAGSQLTSNDDACGGNGSMITYTVPASASSSLQIRAGCYSNKSCSGTVAWTIQ